jgi:hypothetical protein
VAGIFEAAVERRTMPLMTLVQMAPSRNCEAEGADAKEDVVQT